MSAAKRVAIRAILNQVDAPATSAANLDALTDVLRDLSWRAPGEVLVRVPDLTGLDGPDAQALANVLRRAAADAQGTARPIHLEWRTDS